MISIVKRVLPFIFVFFIFALGIAAANFSDLAASKFYSPAEGKSIPEVVVSPTSPYYPLKTSYEASWLAITSRPEARSLTLVKVSQAKLSEINDMLLNLELGKSDQLFEIYANLIKEASENFKLVTDKTSFAPKLTSALEKNIAYLQLLYQRYPERRSAEKIFKSLDITRDLYYTSNPVAVRLVTPVGFDTLKSYNYTFDLRGKSAYENLRIPGSVLVDLFTESGTRNPQFVMGDFLTKYKDSKTFLLVGMETKFALQFAEEIAANPLGKDKIIFVLEHGFVNYAMNTDHPLEGKNIEANKR